MSVHHDTNNIRLTSSEISELFNAYITNKVSICILSYFNAKVEDPDMKTVLMRSQEVAERLLEWNEQILQGANHALPKAFSEEDVNVNAEKLYSDAYMLSYIENMARFSLSSYAEARSSSTRSDVRDFFDEAIRLNIELFDMADDILLGKGLLDKPPVIPIPSKIDLAEKHVFFDELLGYRRPLNASEVNRLYLNYQRNVLGEALLIGFIQTVKDPVIKSHFKHGLEISRKHMNKLASFLRAEDLSVPRSMAQEVTVCTEEVFSDRLMLFHIVGLSSLGLYANGITFSRVMRADLSVAITKFIAEIALYAKEGTNLMIENNWLEQIPLVKDTKELLGTY